MIKKIMSSTLIFILLAMPVSTSANSEEYQFIPYEGYSYNQWDSSIPSAVGYHPSEYIFSDAKKSTEFHAPVDLFVDDEGNLYVLNGQSYGITILDKDLTLKKQITTFKMKDGTALELAEPGGIFVKGQKMYVCDLELGKVLISDFEGNVEMVLEKPKSSIFPQGRVFRPQKVLVDKADNIYVIVEGIYQGAAAFDQNGEFVEFFGSNKVEITASLLMAMFWRNFLTDEQINSSVRNVPVEYTNFDVDKDGFIYTCTAANETSTDEIRKLNPVGDNILPSANYGDIEISWYKGKVLDTRFVDVSVNQDGFIYGLDNSKGRIFVYDNEGALVFIFGGSGSQLGRFQNPVAIDTFGRQVFVLDSIKGAIAVFDLTQYGSKVYDATMAYMDGEYLNSKALWEDVVMMNANYRLGYVGIGKALYRSGEYKKAMEYFKKGGEKAQESRTFTELRKVVTRQYIGIAITVVVVLILLFRVIKRIRKRKAKHGLI